MLFVIALSLIEFIVKILLKNGKRFLLIAKVMIYLLTRHAIIIERVSLLIQSINIGITMTTGIHYVGN